MHKKNQNYALIYYHGGLDIHINSEFINTGKIRQGQMKNFLREIWFNFYRRSSNLRYPDSSGFEHVFVGEYKSTKVNGFHSWIQMYLLERSGHLKYIKRTDKRKVLCVIYL